MATTPTKAGRIAQQVIGACIRALRQQAGYTLEQLASRARLSYQYLSGIETGKENFSIGVLERLCTALDRPLRELIDAAYRHEDSDRSPRVNAGDLRAGVPLPSGLGPAELEATLNQAQLMLFRINRGMRGVIGRSGHPLLRSDLRTVATEVLCIAVAANSSFRAVGTGDRPNCLVARSRGGKVVSLEVEARPAEEVRCESCHATGGWHLWSAFEVDAQGELYFPFVAVAELGPPDDHWERIGETARYQASPFGLTRLLDCTVLATRPPPDSWRSVEQRPPGESVPPWSVFAS
jgi:transcriptional regulator with XRE-family HTH domain